VLGHEAGAPVEVELLVDARGHGVVQEPLVVVVAPKQTAVAELAHREGVAAGLVNLVLAGVVRAARRLLLDVERGGAVAVAARQ
jgi:hypothetical protein